MKAVRVVAPLVLGGVLLLGWQLAWTMRWIDPLLVPSVPEVGTALIELFQSGNATDHIIGTTWLTLRGFLLGFLIGVPMGTMMGLSRIADVTMMPYVEFLRTLPAVALIPLFIVLFEGDLARVLVIATSSGLVFTVTCRAGIYSMEPERREVLGIWRFSLWKLFRYLVVWESLGPVLVACRIAISLAFIVAVVIEMLLGARFGLGDLIVNAFSVEKSHMFAAIAILGILGYAFNGILLWAELHLRGRGVLP